MVQLVERRILALHPGYESGLDIGAASVVMLGLIVGLVADHCRMAGDMADQLADHTLRMEQVGRAGDVHILARAILVWPGRCDRQDLRVFPDQPGRHGIGRCADDHFDAGLVHRFKDAVDRSEIEDAVLRFERAPGRLGDADRGDPGNQHHRDVLVESLVGHVFVVIGDAIAEFGLFHIHRCHLQPPKRIDLRSTCPVPRYSRYSAWRPSISSREPWIR